jgi:hypothetical protein
VWFSYSKARTSFWGSSLRSIVDFAGAIAPGAGVRARLMDVEGMVLADTQPPFGDQARSVLSLENVQTYSTSLGWGQLAMATTSELLGSELWREGIKEVMVEKIEPWEWTCSDHSPKADVASANKKRNVDQKATYHPRPHPRYKLLPNESQIPAQGPQRPSTCFVSAPLKRYVRMNFR